MRGLPHIGRVSKPFPTAVLPGLTLTTALRVPTRIRLSAFGAIRLSPRRRVRSSLKAASLRGSVPTISPWRLPRHKLPRHGPWLPPRGPNHHVHNPLQSPHGNTVGGGRGPAAHHLFPVALPQPCPRRLSHLRQPSRATLTRVLYQDDLLPAPWTIPRNRDFGCRQLCGTSPHLTGAAALSPSAETD